MDYIEITVSTTSAASDAVSDILIGLGAVGTQILDRADLPDVEHPLHDWELMDQSVIDNMPEDVQVKAWFGSENAPGVLEKLPGSLEKLRRSWKDPGTLAVHTSFTPGQDWSENWKKYYKAFRAGRKIVVKPTWESWSPVPGDIILEIDPGMAFGTGTHETTALCVELIEEYMKGGSFLDIGCGSGILGICAAKLGADQVLCIDIDPDAVVTARDNIRQNGLEGTVTAVAGDLNKDIDRLYDTVAANILAPIIIKLCPSLHQTVRKNGLFICSGILLEQADDVEKALTENRFRIIEKRTKGDWASFAAILEA